MRRSILAMSLVLVSAALTYGIQDSEWVKFNAPNARFSLLLPKQPTLEVIPHPENEKLIHNRFSETEQGYAFVIEYFDNIVNLAPEKYLDEVGDEVITTIKATLIHDDKIKLGENFGRDLEYSFTAANGTSFFGRTRIYVVGPALYSLSFVRRKDLDPTRVAGIEQKYFSSFKLSPAN